MAHRGHLGRLERVWAESPIFFVTACTYDRERILASTDFHMISREVWANVDQLYGWRIGRYVVMPDHVHFFLAPAQSVRSLEYTVGKWKEWTAKYLRRRHDARMPLWQEEFFDHVLRSHEGYDEKWRYMLRNPVRAGLVKEERDWPYQGEMSDLRFD
jgi:REP element-mobilizing transposase RayT